MFHATKLRRLEGENGSDRQTTDKIDERKKAALWLGFREFECLCLVPIVQPEEIDSLGQCGNSYHMAVRARKGAATQ